MNKVSFIIAAGLVVLAAASCQKESIPSATPVRVITATFQNLSSKTTLGANETPTWEVGDKIKLLNGSSCQEITVSAGSGIPESGKAYVGENNMLTIGTTLDGQLYAVYPSTATTATSASSDEIAITIPSVQDGTFASANICVAKENESRLCFKNATAVFKFTQSTAGAVKLVLGSEAGICGETTVDCGTMTVATPSTSSITASFASSTEDIYIALAPGSSVNSITAATGAKSRTRTISAGIAAVRNELLSICSIESFDLSNKGENAYVEIAGLKWATCNIGANSPEEYGYYFSWGQTDGHWLNGIRDNDYSFSYKNAPINQNIDPDSGYDAARVNWGGSWRMPTVEECTNLKNACICEPIDPNPGYNNTGIGGFLFTDKNDAGKQIFFPYAGLIEGANYQLYSGTYNCIGVYWTSNRSSDNWAHRLFVRANTGVQTDDMAILTYLGQPIRPVSD